MSAPTGWAAVYALVRDTRKDILDIIEPLAVDVHVLMDERAAKAAVKKSWRGALSDSRGVIVFVIALVAFVLSVANVLAMAK